MNINIIKKYVCLCVMLLLCAVPAWSATTTVSTVAELTSTISSAASGDIIILVAGTYSLTGELAINKTLTIKGNSSGGTVISRDISSSCRIINISGGIVTLENLTIQGGTNSNLFEGSGGVYVSNGVFMSLTAL